MKTLWPCALATALLSSCAHVRPDAATCGPLPANLEAVPAGNLLVLGDMHGTREVPRFVGEVACAMAQRGPTLLGLEMPAHPTFDAFFKSDGGPAAKAALLSGPFWQDAFQDGRRSVAAFELLERVRRWREQGLPLDIYFFDAAGAEGVTRDEAMARLVNERRRQRPGVNHVLMMGNLHARKKAGSPWSPQDGYRWMTSMLEGPVTTLNLRSAPGTAWTCMSASDCGPHFASNGGQAETHEGLVLAPNDTYDGVFDVVSLTASPPAAQPEAAKSIDQRIADVLAGPGPVVAQAMADYDRGDFAGCARRLDAIARPTVDTHYAKACCFARAGRKDEALQAIQEALKQGFKDFDALAKDEDLVSLHDDPRWPKRP